MLIGRRLLNFSNQHRNNQHCIQINKIIEQNVTSIDSSIVTNKMLTILRSIRFIAKSAMPATIVQQSGVTALTALYGVVNNNMGKFPELHRSPRQI